MGGGGAEGFENGGGGIHADEWLVKEEGALVAVVWVVFGGGRTVAVGWLFSGGIAGGSEPKCLGLVESRLGLRFGERLMQEWFVV